MKNNNGRGRAIKTLGDNAMSPRASTAVRNAFHAEKCIDTYHVNMSSSHDPSLLHGNTYPSLHRAFVSLPVFS